MWADQLDRSGMYDSQSDEQHIEDDPREKLTRVRHNALTFMHKGQAPGCAVDAPLIASQRFSPPTAERKNPNCKSSSHDEQNLEHSEYRLIHAVERRRQPGRHTCGEAATCCGGSVLGDLLNRSIISFALLAEIDRTQPKQDRAARTPRLESRPRE